MTEFLLLAFILLVAGVVSVPIATRFGLGLGTRISPSWNGDCAIAGFPRWWTLSNFSTLPSSAL